MIASWGADSCVVFWSRWCWSAFVCCCVWWWELVVGADVCWVGGIFVLRGVVSICVGHWCWCGVGVCSGMGGVQFVSVVFVGGVGEVLVMVCCHVLMFCGLLGCVTVPLLLPVVGWGGELSLVVSCWCCESAMELLASSGHLCVLRVSLLVRSLRGVVL
jgi:hypothetical protein